MQLVKVQYYSETTGDLSARSYTYFSEDELKVGDVVIVPVKDTTGRAKVSAVDMPEAEIQAFRDKVRVIPAGSGEPEKKVDAGPYSSQEFPDPAAGAAQSPADIETVTAVATIKVKPQDDPRIVALADEATKLRDFAIARTINTDADCKPATDDLSIIARVKKALTEARAEYVKPIRGYLEDVNAAFTKILAPLDEADKVTRSKILSYRDAQAKRAAQAEQLNREAADLARRQAEFSGTGEFTVDTKPVEAPAPVKRVSTELGTAGVVRNLTWELVEFSAVPDQYKVLDAGKITKLVKAGGSITGIKVIEGETLRVTTRK